MSLARVSVIAGVVAMASLTASTAIATAEPPAASGTDVTTLQIPAHGFVVSGLVVPGVSAVRVTATSNEPGVVTFAAPTRPEVCATTMAGSLVRIDYLNLATGGAGSVMVKPCENFLEATPVEATANIGTGPVVFAVSITGSAYSPTAGQPSIPGIGAFAAP
ncbi:hypothetical protein ONR57_12115 [Hoyosella sp. YIM 151337]|uniref:hypothetical protein n=1 Tax=Hoyosella sp. YIM 151337 TaxID=2992742 RepID=UPI002236AE16|nr:hypothetical protein [Hoyosella sp. YIM 151337]MCW4354045.1 hypothetical protein [Hoyosella sp. YIM 151337]